MIVTYHIALNKGSPHSLRLGARVGRGRESDGWFITGLPRRMPGSASLKPELGQIVKSGGSVSID